MQTIRLVTDQDTDQPARVDLATAAAQLGCTVDSIRKRIRRRQLAAEKVDGRWYVVLAPPSHRASPGSSAATTAASLGQDTGQSDSPLVQALQAEIAFLRRALETRDEELRRKDSILLALAQRPALPAAKVVCSDSEQTTAGELLSETDNNSRPQFFSDSEKNCRPRWWARWWPWGGKGT